MNPPVLLQSVGIYDILKATDGKVVGRMKLLLADSSEVFCNALESQLDRLHDVQVCHDGVMAAQLLFESSPDLLVLDMMLPGLDGFTILQSLKDAGQRVPVIVTAYNLTQFEYDWLQSLQVDCVLLKPCSICQVMLRIHEVLQHHANAEKSSFDNMVERILLSLGLRMNLVGYEYVCWAVRFLAEDPGRTLTKEIYPAVAAACDATPQGVERAIRTVLRDAWSRRNEAVWRMYFPRERSGMIPCPQNGTFLSRIAACLTEIVEKVC